ncbi:hypothetical protein GCM10011414_00170 [Croceivirga lutea]|uniref:endonuclease/exonuclease/phosphatase family protein n=1 Tax=Croceivirga lutea TaxID=1775167 RepID=UPI00163AB9FC|nr:endonuclease/exonuclease/phosphatase family protein [Croceivirga lutea]GGG34683.1 hypothetical protein GCM10011414_00170 [Croceivirga lutea]
MRINLIILGLVFFSLVNFKLQAQHKAMSYNIRYSTSNDGENAWDNRKEAVVALIKNYEPDFLGIQEGLLSQVAYLNKNLADYAYTGVGRDDGKEKGEFSAIFYNGKAFKLITGETFWLSTTPEKISVGWDAAMERICTYALFEHLTTGEKIYVFNAHFDHIGEQARKNSALLIEQKLQQLQILTEPVIVMGDFNSEPNSPPIQTFTSYLDDGVAISEKSLYGPKGTFNGFDENLIPQNRIDYIFCKNLKSVQKYRHINDKRNNGLCPSDHLPIYMEFTLNKKITGYDVSLSETKNQSIMQLGNFSISLAVKDIKASKAFYEKLGFTEFGGDIAQNWLILQNDTCTIGLFQGMFDKNTLTFNPGWDNNANNLKEFTDIRQLKEQLEAENITILSDGIKGEKGPGNLVLMDPDGNPILIDQHR